MTPLQIEKFHELGLPQHMLGALERYIDEAIYPGGFLAAVIKNDLMTAVMNADQKNREALASWVHWFFNYAPAYCCGHKNAIADYAEYIHQRKVDKEQAEAEKRAQLGG